jgi:DNA-binding NarL/FixJ family response regulator
VVAAFQNPAPQTQKDADLTERENELLGLLAKGYANKQIAERMGLTLESVKTYLKRVYDKLHVHCRTEAAVHYLNKAQ